MNFETRLKEEFQELRNKISKLEVFTASKKFDTVSEVQKNLLIVQLASMHTYATCLQQRLYNL